MPSHIFLVVHPAGAYPGFRSMKRLGVFLISPGSDASPSQSYPHHQVRRYPFIHLGRERHCESKVSFPRAQHNVGQSPARTRTARSGDERNNHEATAPRPICNLEYQSLIPLTQHSPLKSIVSSLPLETGIFLTSSPSGSKGPSEKQM